MSGIPGGILIHAYSIRIRLYHWAKEREVVQKRPAPASIPRGVEGRGLRETSSSRSMDTPPASEQLRAVARRIVTAVAERVMLRGALLAGSAGRGDADYYSDVDLLFYVDEIPPTTLGAELCERLGGTQHVRKDKPTEQFSAEEFDVGGLRVEISFWTVRWIEARLDALLDDLADFDTPSQKILSGLLEGLPLHGAELLGRWRARVAAYPEPLRKAMVERYWSFFALWYASAAMARRDAELWRQDMLVDAAFNLLGVLAGLNRVYFTRFQFKHLRRFVSQMSVCPVGLADRLESLFRLDPESAAAELERLIEEAATLVHAELPDVDLRLRFPPGTRQLPWRDPQTKNTS